MSGRIAVFGNLSIDDLVFIDGSTRWAVPGGNAMYAGLGMAVWGERAVIIAPVGSDYPIDTFRSSVDLSRCPSVPKTLRSWGLYEEDGSRHFIFRNETHNWKDFCPAPQSALSGAQAAAHIAPMPREVALAIVRELRKTPNTTIAIDLDERDLHVVDLQRIGELIRSCDLFLPSNQEARAIFPKSRPDDALRRLRELAPEARLIVVKCGAEGVIGHAAGASEFIRVPSVPVEVVDATGGGDSFCGGLLAGFIHTADLMQALLCGVVSASFCVEGLGLDGLLAATYDRAASRLDMLRQRVTLHPM